MYYIVERWLGGTLTNFITIKKSIKKSKLVIFKNCAHNVHLEQPDQFNNTIKNFLL